MSDKVHVGIGRGSEVIPRKKNGRKRSRVVVRLTQNNVDVVLPFKLPFQYLVFSVFKFIKLVQQDNHEFQNSLWHTLNNHPMVKNTPPNNRFSPTYMLLLTSVPPTSSQHKTSPFISVHGIPVNLFIYIRTIHCPKTMY